MPALLDRNGIPILGKSDSVNNQLNELLLQIKQGRAYIQQLEVRCEQMQMALMNNGNLLAFFLNKQGGRVRIPIDEMKKFLKESKGKIRSMRDNSTKSIIVELIPLTDEELKMVEEATKETEEQVNDSNEELTQTQTEMNTPNNNSNEENKAVNK